MGSPANNKTWVQFVDGSSKIYCSVWYREKHHNRLETSIHFTEEKAIREAQLVALSAEIVFLAATNNPSSASDATAHRHADASLMLSCCAIIALSPKARHLHCGPPQKMDLLCSITNQSPVWHLIGGSEVMWLLQLQRNLGKQDKSCNLVCCLQWGQDIHKIAVG